MKDLRDFIIVRTALEQGASPEQLHIEIFHILASMRIHSGQDIKVEIPGPDRGEIYTVAITARPMKEST